MTITVYNEDGDEVVVKSHKVVCPDCRGEGTHVNRAIDGNGITAEEFYDEWDDESREMYLTGGYDVVCETCKGKNVIDEADERDPNYNLWIKEQRDLAEMYAIEAAERRMGA